MRKGMTWKGEMTARLAVAGTLLGAVGIPLAARPTEAQSTTTTIVRTATPAKRRKLKSRELPLAPGSPYASLPNYVATAVALRHWRQPDVSFYVVPSTVGKRTPEQTRALVAQGIALWQDRIAKKLVLRLTDDADSADVVVELVPSGTLSGGRIGETDISFTVPEQDIQHAKIQLVEGLSTAQFVQCIAHESGHALGIQGHSDMKGDLMFAYAHLPAAISERDANTMNAGYYQVVTTNRVRAFKRGQQFGSVKSY